jgi:hypothetical protein
MVAVGVTLAIVMSALPIAVLLLLRARADRPAWLVALDIPTAVALDLVAVFLISHLVVLDLAAWITKGLWLLVGAAVLVARRRRGRRVEWPVQLTRSLLLQALVVGVVGLLVSMAFSRRCAMWDRPFHIPFLTSMRGQTAPFVTVYEPWKALYYHYGGNLFAATLQAYSLGILHASHALTLLHDLAFFGLGISLGLTLRAMGVRHLPLLVLVYLGMMLSGPYTPLQGEHRTWFAGYSLTNWLSISYRPHMSLAAWITLPFLAVPAVRLREMNREVPLGDLVLPLVACIPALMTVDEFSVGTLGLGLGALWLVYPRVFAPTRKRGLLLFAALGASLAFSVLVMRSTVALGAPHYPLALVAPRTPGFYTDPVPFSTARGVVLFLSDVFPVLGVLVGGAWLLLRWRDSSVVGMYTFYAAMSLVSIFLFTTLFYTGGGLQNHRFLTVPMLSSPFVVAALLAPRPGGSPPLTSLPALLMVAVLALASDASLNWIGGWSFNDCRSSGLPENKHYYTTDCRSETGAGVVNRRTKPMYLDPEILYLAAGCRPGFMAGPPASMDGHDLKVGTARLGIEGLRELHHDRRFLDPAADLDVTCSRKPTADPACALLKQAGGCAPAGSELMLCSMTPAQRKAALGE